MIGRYGLKTGVKQRETILGLGLFFVHHVGASSLLNGMRTSDERQVRSR
jgi:hypothetical protein